MVRNKLTEQDQQAIVSQYRTSDVTTGVLAEQFGVSASTITRILKDAIPDREYQVLVRSRRSGPARSKSVPDPVLPEALSEESQLSLIDSRFEQVSGEGHSEGTEDPDAESEMDPEVAFDSIAFDSGREVSDLDPEPDFAPEESAEPEEDLDHQDLDDQDLDDEDPDDEDLNDESEDPETIELRAELEDPLEKIGFEEDDSLDDEDLDLDDDEEDDDEEDELETYEPDPTPALQVLSLGELDYPPVCYVVIDRHQELTTRPLEEFTALDLSALAEEGIPEEELRRAKTLPIFDSHRVARRFSDLCKRDGNAPHRIIQFDGRTLVVASSQLKRKGITHLLVDGQIFSL